MPCECFILSFYFIIKIEFKSILLVKIKIKMSLLSRFRKTVKSSKPMHDTESKRSLSTSRKESLGPSDNHQHNYRKPTQSFNEKLLKPHNTFQSYSDADDQRRKTHRTEPIRKNSKTETITKNSKSTSANSGLSRSGTFTMNDIEVKLSDQHVSRHIKKEDSHDDSYDEHDKYSKFKSNGGKQDIEIILS